MYDHETKTTPVILPADGEGSWSLLPSSVSLLSGGTVQAENTYPCILKHGMYWGTDLPPPSKSTPPPKKKIVTPQS